LPTSKVFISYSHDSPEHMQRVLELSNTLRKRGVDAEIDQYEESPPQGWPQWCEEQLRPEESRFVLVICTANYLARVQGKVPANEGRGVYWEGQILYNYLYSAKFNTRFIPLLLRGEPEDSIPIPLHGHTRYSVAVSDLSDAGFDALYRRLTGQPTVVKPDLGPVDILTRGAVAKPLLGLDTIVAPSLPARAARSAFNARPTPEATVGFDIDRIYAYAPNELIGREAETAVIADAWQKAAKGDAHPHVLTFVALGGGGKTSLVAHWVNEMAARGWPGCEAAFAWSFYRQSSSEQAGASSDLFLAEALKFFRLPTIEGESGYEKGKRLAREIGQMRAVLILDGLEPLQYAPSAAHRGDLKDDALRALMRGLAQRNGGLCIVTTRYRVEDLKGPAVSQCDLAPLSEAAGAELLARLGVRGPEKERAKLSADVQGHALTLEIIGSYLRRAHGGEIARRDRIKLNAASAAKGGHAMRAMAAYADWFASGGEDGFRALALLRLTGLFDRPVNTGCLAALWAAPAVEGLTEALVNLSEDERNLTLSELEAAKLLTVKWSGGALAEIDAHPLVREYFASELREKRPSVWQAAHRRLFEHLIQTPDKATPELEDLQPLYQAVAHGCAAGLWEQARADIYRDRILRGTGMNGFYSTKKLGAIATDLGAVACFFDVPWGRVSTRFTPANQAWLLSLAGQRLRALGRLEEAKEPIRCGLQLHLKIGPWKVAAMDSQNLASLELSLGDIEAAKRAAVAGVAYADKSRDPFNRMVARAVQASTLHQLGQRAKAEALFKEAEAMQAQGQPQYPLLYSVQGFLHCEVKLNEAERLAWRQLIAKCDEVTLANGASAREPVLGVCSSVMLHASRTLGWGKEIKAGPLPIGLNHLTLARARVYAALLGAETPPNEHLDEAISYTRLASRQDYLPASLLTRAVYRSVTGDFPGAREDLDEAYEIAERGPMRLHLADIYLHRARLFGLLADSPQKYPWTSPQTDLSDASKLIEQCGYKRRLPELEDAGAALATQKP